MVKVLVFSSGDINAENISIRLMTGEVKHFSSVH